MDSLGGMEIFVRVVEEGSFSAAARALGQTPSAVSKQVARLEDRLGARLLDRTTRRLRLTEVGAAYADRARRILAEVTEAEQAVSSLGDAPRGTLRLNLPMAFGRLHIAPILPDFLAAYPEVRIDVTLNDRFIDPLEEGVDVVVRVGDLADSSLIARRLAANRRVVCGAPTHFAAHGWPQSPADLAAHNCLVYTYRASRHDWPFLRTGADGAVETEMVRVGGVMESNNVEALYAAVLAGVGLGLFPLWLIGPDLAAGRLQRALPRCHSPDSAIHALYPPGRHLSPKVRAFVDFLAAHAAREWTWDFACETGVSAGSGADR